MRIEWGWRASLVDPQKNRKARVRDEAFADTDIVRAEAEALAFAAIEERPDEEPDVDEGHESHESHESSIGEDDEDPFYLIIIQFK